MSDVKSLTRSFGETKSVELDEERMLRVIATAPTLDRDLEVLDTKTARIPIKPKGWKYAEDLTVEDDIDIPFLVDHDQWNGIQKQAGSVKKMYINESGELEAIVKLSTVEMGEHVYTLAKEGHLGNSFSIGFSMMNATEDAEAIKNYEITELSAVFKGSNRDARLTEVKSIEKQEASDLDVKKAKAAKLLKEIEAAEAAKIEKEAADEIIEVLSDTPEAKETETPATDEGSDTEEVTVNTLTQEQRAEATKSIKTHVAKVKGIVADVANADGSWEAEDDKWEALEPVRDLFYALQEAYYFTPTKVEDFDVLLAEFSELVAALARKESDVKMSDQLTKAFDGKSLDDIKQVVDTIVGTVPEVEEEAPAVEAEKEKEKEKDENEVVEADEEAEEAEPEVESEEVVEKVEVESATEAEKTEPDTETKKETKTMSKDIAKKMVIDPADQPAVDTKATASNYLDSRQAVKDFGRVLVKSAGKSAEGVKAAWAAELEAKGITNPEVLLPTPVLSRITALLESEGPIWTRLRKTGAKAFRVAIDSNTGDTARAGGHQRGDVKDEEVITLVPRLIRSQMIYKYIVLDRETEFEDDGALMDYISEELPRRIIAEIERAVVIGDGREDTDKRKIREIRSIREDAVSGSGYAVRFTEVAGLTPFQKLVRAGQELETEGSRLLVAKKSFLGDLTLQENANGGLVFAPGTNLASLLGYEDIYTPRWMNEDTENDAYDFVPNSYYTVGQTSVEAFSDFKLSTNQYEYLQEIFVGGALVDLVSGVAIASEDASQSSDQLTSLY